MVQGWLLEKKAGPFLLRGRKQAEHIERGQSMNEPVEGPEMLILLPVEGGSVIVRVCMNV